MKHATVRPAALAGLGLLLGLTGCATPPGPDPDVARQTIQGELARAQAARPAPPLPAAVAQGLLPPVSAPLPTHALPEPRFDLALTNAPVAQVFHAIASGSRYSILLPPGLAGSVTLNLKEVTVREALDTLRELYGFEYRVDGNRVFVQAAGLQTRVFQVSFPAARRSGRTDTKVVSGGITAGAAAQAGTTGSPEGSHVTTINDADFWKELDAALKAVLGAEPGRSVVVSQHSGVIVVRANARELREVEQFLKASRLAIERQVMLEAKIVEVTLRDGFESGINWSAFTGAGNHRWSIGADPSRINVPGSIGRSFGVPTGSLVTPVDSSSTPATAFPGTLGQLLASPFTSGGASALGLAFTTNSFAALLAFLESQGTVQVLSSPRVAATHNQKALLRVGTDDFFITNISTTTTASSSGTVTTPTIQVQPFFSGIALDVTPQISDDGMVTMHVRPVVSEVAERTRVVNLGNLGTFTLPLASSRINETDTIVRVADGVTVAIGGLMTQTQSNDDARVPGAGDVPVLGNLFKRTQRNLQKRELVFLLKPTVIKGDEQWRADVAAADERMRTMTPRPERLTLPTGTGGNGQAEPTQRSERDVP